MVNRNSFLQGFTNVYRHESCANTIGCMYGRSSLPLSLNLENRSDSINFNVSGPSKANEFKSLHKFQTRVIKMVLRLAEG